MHYSRFFDSTIDLKNFLTYCRQQCNQLNSLQNIPRYQLISHNFGTNIVEYLELTTPFMFMYEAMINEEQAAYLITWTENEQICFRTSLPEILASNRPMHFHNFYEINFILSGSITFQIEEETITYHAGEICLCNRRIRHKEIFTEDCEVIDIMLTEDYFHKLLSSASSFPFHGKGFDPFSLDAPLADQTDTALYYPAKKVYYEFRMRESVNAHMDILCYYLVLSLTELYEQQPGAVYFVRGTLYRLLALLENPKFCEVIPHLLTLSANEKLFYSLSKEIEERRGIISTEELEQLLNYNSEYLNRIVKRYTSLTLTDYKRSFLLKEASRLLKETDCSVTEICEKLGYSNRTYFNRVFRERYRMTPGQFRKEHRE